MSAYHSMYDLMRRTFQNQHMQSTTVHS